MAWMDIPITPAIWDALGYGALVLLAYCFLACWWSNRLDQHAGIDPMAPTVIYGVFGLPSLIVLLVLAAQAVLSASVVKDPCLTTDPNESWAAWIAWMLAGCGL